MTLRITFCILLIFVTRFCVADPICESTTYSDLPAYRLSDGKVEAVVVPSLSGRVMRFGEVGGNNWIWNLPNAKSKPGQFTNWGGDKTFVGPHPVWKTLSDNIWPPCDPTWDGLPHEAEVLPGGKLRTTGPAWKLFGIRVIRDFGFEPNGEFVVTQTLEKVSGEPRLVALWQVAQLVPPAKVYVPLADRSAYRDGFFPFAPLPPSATIAPALNGALSAISPQAGASYKLGFDAPVPAIAAVRGNRALILRAPLEKGDYPDGAYGAGFPVEFYNDRAKDGDAYVELELLTPLRRMDLGERITNRIHWKIAELPAVAAEAEAALLVQLKTPVD